MWMIRHYIVKGLADSTTRHGVFLDALGVGVMITGDSGVGKSELALELITRGSGLVADDITELYRISPETLEGRCPELLRDFLEVRGLGMLNIRTMFGETAVRRKKSLKLIVHLYRPPHDDLSKLERLPLNATLQEILGVKISKVEHPGDGRPQPRGAGGSRGAQLRAAAARHRHHAGIHLAPRKLLLED